ncbi:MAG: SRPBCC domain-containing protein [Myxococcales bacterium]|nr:SRPBCC domain-containing protein [Myxococcales bacterium]
MAKSRKPNELHIERVYDAPVKRVWEAWTDPAQVAQWWGPRGFTLTTRHKDVRTGGSWLYTMHGPDGVDYPNHTKFLEVVEYARLVYDHGGYEDKPPLFRVTVTFSESEGKTTMDMTMTLPSAQAAEEAKVFIKKAGGEATWDRLAEYLAPTDRFVINRSFDAAPETIFEMWTNPAHIVHWLPPTGFTMTYLRANISPGGTSFFRMDGPGGMSLHVQSHHQELVRPHRIVYSQTFCDEHEQPCRPPFAETWPASLSITVTLTEEAPHQTRVTLFTEVKGAATEVERTSFHQGKAGMTQGWTGSFDELERRLATTRPA